MGGRDLAVDLGGVEVPLAFQGVQPLAAGVGVDHGAWSAPGPPLAGPGNCSDGQVVTVCDYPIPILVEFSKAITYYLLH